MSCAVKDVLAYGKKFLSEHEIDPREARLLLAYSMGILADDLVRQEICTEEQYLKFQEVLQRRIQGEPYAYIVGQKEFMKLSFKVTPETLIPREDTEVLVQEAIQLCQHFTNHDKLQVIDMCTGSGCIAIAIAKYCKNARVDAVDISKGALVVATENALQNGVDVNFIHSNLFEKVEKQYDMIVSNPPYITKAELQELQQEVKREPLLALDGGEDGLVFYRQIVQQGKIFLKEEGYLLLEIGYQQGKSVSELMRAEGYQEIKVLKDLSSNDRVVIGRRG